MLLHRCVKRGRVLFRQLPWLIGIIECPEKPAPVGTASDRGRTDDGLALWSLKVRGADVPGWFVIIDGQFVPYEGAAD
jgi:hypothetical protein